MVTELVYKVRDKSFIILLRKRRVSLDFNIDQISLHIGPGLKNRKRVILSWITL